MASLMPADFPTTLRWVCWPRLPWDLWCSEGSIGDSGHRKWFFQLGRVFYPGILGGDPRHLTARRKRFRFGRESRMGVRAIDLPGERRIIQSVDLWYGKDRWNKRPKVSLNGIR